MAEQTTQQTQQAQDQKQQDRSLEGKKGGDPRHRRLRAGRAHRAAQGARRGRRADEHRLAEEGQGARLEFTDWGAELKVDVPLAQAKADEFDALLLPGGVMNPDTLRMDDRQSISPRRSSRLASRWRRSATGRGW
jgi:putative intracellular protease/amidase